MLGVLDDPRRRALAGAALILVGLAVVAAVVVGHVGGGDGDGGDGDGSRPASTPSAAAFRTVSVPALGLRFRHPADWPRTTAGRAIRLRSPEGGVVLTISSPVAGRHDRDVKQTLLATLKARLAPAKVLRDGPGLLGRRKVASTELSGRSGGRTVRALTLVGSTDERTYAVTLVTAARPSAARLREAQGILASLTLSKPLRAGS